MKGLEVGSDLVIGLCFRESIYATEISANPACCPCSERATRLSLAPPEHVVQRAEQRQSATNGQVRPASLPTGRALGRRWAATGVKVLAAPPRPTCAPPAPSASRGRGVPAPAGRAAAGAPGAISRDPAGMQQEAQQGLAGLGLLYLAPFGPARRLNQRRKLIPQR